MALTATTIKETRFRTFIAACVLKGEKLSYDKNVDRKREKKGKKSLFKANENHGCLQQCSKLYPKATINLQPFHC